MLQSIVVGIWVWIHPFHVSVTEIEHREEKKAVQISVRLFLDDLELGLRNYSGNDSLDIASKADSAFINQQLASYLSENLKLNTEKRPINFKYLGSEYDVDVMWCYMEALKVKPFQKLKIKNSILVEIWETQENIVQVKKNGKTKGLRFTPEKVEQDLTWEKAK